VVIPAKAGLSTAELVIHFAFERKNGINLDDQLRCFSRE
jgi:hypothetical protein